MKKLAAEQEEAIERQTEITSALWKMPREAPISEKLSIASNTLFLTCRNDGLPERDMITALALASGFACGVMSDAAEKLKELGQ